MDGSGNIMKRGLPGWVMVGVSFREEYGNDQDSLWHIRGIVDDMAVCRRWWPVKRRWQYQVLDDIWFDTLLDRLRPVNTTKK